MSGRRRAPRWLNVEAALKLVVNIAFVAVIVIAAFELSEIFGWLEGGR
jgi:hypothetical protein